METTENTITLAGAKAAFIAQVKDGAICPCCGRHAAINRISINGSMVHFLEWILQYNGWIPVQNHAPAWVLRSNSHAKMLYWGLLDRLPTEDGKGNSGVYRITAKGRLFLSGQISVKKYMLVYNNISLIPNGVGENVTVFQCRGKKFKKEEAVL